MYSLIHLVMYWAPSVCLILLMNWVYYGALNSSFLGGKADIKRMRAQSLSCVQLFAIPWDPVRLLCPWDFPGKNTRVGGHFRSRGFSWPRDWTHISCITRISRQILYTFTSLFFFFLNHWVTWEVQTLNSQDDFFKSESMKDHSFMVY